MKKNRLFYDAYIYASKNLGNLIFYPEANGGICVKTKTRSQWGYLFSKRPEANWGICVRINVHIFMHVETNGGICVKTKVHIFLHVKGNWGKSSEMSQKPMGVFVEKGSDKQRVNYLQFWTT
ncbi:MAG TPA: hypothetical protein PLS50_07175 [Candidatus Dojkabacteria bacterium]|nr:hypothetical protein [Candidatus Dojkabacteria bacterium]